MNIGSDGYPGDTWGNCCYPRQTNSLCPGCCCDNRSKVLDLRELLFMNFYFDLSSRLCKTQEDIQPVIAIPIETNYWLLLRLRSVVRQMLPSKMPNQLRHLLRKRQCQSHRLRIRRIRRQWLWKLVFFRSLFQHQLWQCLHLQALPSLRLLRNQRNPKHQQSQQSQHQHRRTSQQWRVSKRIFRMGQHARLGVELWSPVFASHSYHIYIYMHMLSHLSTFF